MALDEKKKYRADGTAIDEKGDRSVVEDVAIEEQGGLSVPKNSIPPTREQQVRPVAPPQVAQLPTVNTTAMQPTQVAAQDALRALREAQNRRMTAARGSAAVMGASAGSVTAEKNAANLGAGQAISDLAARGDAISREARKAYQQREINYYNNEIGEANNMAHNAGLAGSELSKLGGGMIGKNLFGEKST